MSVNTSTGEDHSQGDHPDAELSGTADISAGEESSNSHSKRESQCSSDHPDAKQTRLADTSTGEDSSQSDHPDAERSRIAAQTTVKDMNRGQELDQYEDHDTWLKMVKQDWYSFQRLKEAQTDQQRKRLNMFVARFQDQFPVQYQCDGCGVILSDIRYRCLNCIDVDFCYDCYTKRVKAEGHTENHEVIEMRLVLE
ncbi:zinc finger ZZ-type and EF-hand domain-containing protein 1-like [Orbicella faveolata]|uniref:zinc finger ZZ-type and EF-hand domain-containing protein 1-like n=1 Tax=Orbicella faveolata TaxID=48498 RepID=UPI0009E36FBA|nr:zinc finger ZZ-type and EF-hand domain-containing protein 1-like [Orbicella faveolata]